ncbi:MAG: twin-arginine translocase subunit TatC [Actinomycetaceae bacterium]|nr:twin-arginine translocase subunit TatC [Actinomycetaceae bacterium]
MPRENPKAVMRISEHLRELRKRLLLSIGGIAVASVAGWFLYEPVMEIITYPITSSGTSGLQLNFQTIGAAFDMKMRVSIWVGILLSSPWWIGQLAAFIAPALKRREKIFVLAFGLAGLVLFASGAFLGMLIAPRAVTILNSFTPEGAASLLRADAYITFYTRLVILFGLSFLLPVALVAANFAGLIRAISMLKAWRWVVVSCFIFTAIANPLPSPWPMTVQAIILISLYLIAVGISALNEWWKRKHAAKDKSGIIKAE